ncbi:MAG: hypothetical protein ACTSWY_08625 [Promethearchaeota archaeon]
MILWKKKITRKELQEDTSLKLTEEQKRELQNTLKNEEEKLQMLKREVYRVILVPQKEGFRLIDLGIPTYGVKIDF